MIVRTVTAVCDGTTDEGFNCDVSLDLEQGCTSPLSEIEGLGWTVRLIGPEDFVFCPEHGGQGDRT